MYLHYVQTMSIVFGWYLHISPCLQVTAPIQPVGEVGAALDVATSLGAICQAGLFAAQLAMHVQGPPAEKNHEDPLDFLMLPMCAPRNMDLVFYLLTKIADVLDFSMKRDWISGCLD